MLPMTLLAIFLSLAFLHVYWAFGGAWGASAAIPQRNGNPIFSPSPFATCLVAAGLLACAVLVAALAGWVAVPLLTNGVAPLGYGLSALFFLRSVGDFKLVGFFKRERGTRFARFDTLLFSPLSLGLALGVLRLASLPRP